MMSGDGDQKKLHVACIVLARGGSKGIPLKNIKELAGLPLLAWVIRAAKASKVMDSIWVSTDHDEIARVAEEWGASVFHRSAEYAQDTTKSIDSIREFADQHPEVDVFCNVQCTSPCLRPEHLADPVNLICQKGYDSVFAVERQHTFRWKEVKEGENTMAMNFDPKSRPRRQEWDGELYENGQFYMFTRELLYKGYLQGGKVAYHEMEPKYSVDIDTELDWPIAEQRALKYGYQGP